MGHIRLGNLPRTRKWKEVIDLVGGEGSTAMVANATMDAAQDDFQKGAADPLLVHTVWLLSQLPDAARQEDFQAAARALGLELPAQASPTDIAVAVGEAVDAHARLQDAPRSDLGEMARLAAVETLARALEPATPSLFGSTPGEGKDALGRLATEKQFGGLTRDFFARLTERVLTHFVSKELPLHVGAGRRFETPTEQRAFQDAMGVHAKQAARILEVYAGAWWSKARHEGDLTPARAERFVAYAMKKMRDELRRGAAG